MCPPGTILGFGECDQIYGRPDCSVEACCTPVATPCTAFACIAPFKHNDVDVCIPGSTTCEEQCCERDATWRCGNQPVSAQDVCSPASVWMNEKYCTMTNGVMDCSVCCSDPVTCHMVNEDFECGPNEGILEGNNDECLSVTDCSNCCVPQADQCMYQNPMEWCDVANGEWIPPVDRECGSQYGVKDCHNCCYKQYETYN